MDTERLRRRARFMSICCHRKEEEESINHHVIQRPTKQLQSRLSAYHLLISFMRNVSLCLLFLLQSDEVRGQHSDFQPIRLPSAQRHHPVLVPLPTQLRAHHSRRENLHQHYHHVQQQQQQQQQRQQFRQQYQRSAQLPSAHEHQSSNNLSYPPTKRQDHRTSNFITTLNERVHLAKINRDHRHQQEHQHEAISTPRQTKSLDPNHLPHERQHSRSPVSDRRASSSSWSPNHLLQDGRQSKFSQPQLESVPNPTQSSEKQPSEVPDTNGKLLVCYYTTRQMAPYWPKEGREFVVPPEKLSSLMSASGVDMLDPTLQQSSSVNVGSFNDRYPNYQRPEAKHLHSKYSEQPKFSAATSGERRQMILVAPRFMPVFNGTSPTDSNHERQRPDNGPLTQLFFMSPTGSPTNGHHHHHHSISSRQDNLPVASTLGSASGPTSMPLSGSGELRVADKQNNGFLGGEQRRQRVSEDTFNFMSSSLPTSSTNAGRTMERESSNSNVDGGKINNGESNAANFVQMRHQHQSKDTSVAPPTSRTFIGSSSINSAPPSSWPTTLSRDNHNELHATSLPTSPNVMSNNYYYYYNNNNQPSSPTTTVSFPTSTSAAQSALNSGSASLQRAKSLQMAESELSPALQLGVSTAPVPQSSASFSPASMASASTQQTVATVLGISPTGGATFASQQHQQQQQHQHEHLLKIQGSQMVPLGQASDEQKATTSLVLNAGPSSTMLSVSSVGTTTSGATSRPNLPIVLTADDLLIAGRQQQQKQHQYDSGPLASSLVSSPLSTVFDVFGAASQYLMRFKPSSLISPGAFSSNFNSQSGQLANLAQHQRQSTSGLLTASPQNNFKSNSSSLFSSSAASFISFPFSNGLLSAGSGNQLAKSIESPTSTSASERNTNSTTSKGGFLSRLTFHGSSQQQQQRREDICGRTIQTPERRIIGGEGAKYGEFPYQVHIKIAKHQCGGALVDRQSIVTAAHCVYHFITRAPVSKLQIVIGAYDIEDEQYQELPPQYFKVNKVKLHPNFRFSASHPDRYDIAILKLDKPVKYTDNVLPVCLPGKDLRFENMVGTVTGFGKTDPSLSNRYGTRLLQKVDVPIIENNECERWHRTRGIDLKIFPEMMCAGYEDGLKDACVGDSGGPLVVKTAVGSNGSFRWTLAGITSAGFGCAQSRQPGIYHRVSHTVDWILENLD